MHDYSHKWHKWRETVVVWCVALWSQWQDDLLHLSGFLPFWYGPSRDFRSFLIVFGLSPTPSCRLFYVYFRGIMHYIRVHFIRLSLLDSPYVASFSPIKVFGDKRTWFSPSWLPSFKELYFLFLKKADIPFNKYSIMTKSELFYMSVDTLHEKQERSVSLQLLDYPWSWYLLLCCMVLGYILLPSFPDSKKRSHVEVSIRIQKMLAP